MDEKTIRSALAGNRAAQEACTRDGVALPCPFCGSEGHIVTHSDGSGHVGCRDADIRVGSTHWSMVLVSFGKNHPKQEALQAWNSRASLSDGKSNGSYRHVTNKLNSSKSTSIQGWIPCSEQLPEIGQSTLIYPIDGDIDLGIYKGGGNWTFYDFTAGTSHITHWMPIPGSPEDERDGN